MSVLQCKIFSDHNYIVEKELNDWCKENNIGPYDIKDIKYKINEKLCLILRTIFATRCTFVHLRVTHDKRMLIVAQFVHSDSFFLSPDQNKNRLQFLLQPIFYYKL
mgnify:CR=1 FL=1